MARFNFKRIDNNSGTYINLFSDYKVLDNTNASIIQSADIYDMDNEELFEHDLIHYSCEDKDIIFELYYCTGLCRFEVEVVNSNLEVEFGDFLLNYLPFSKKIGNSLIKNNI